MTKLFRAVIACISAMLISPSIAPIAWADTIDPLHGHCLASFATCTGNGTNTPIIGPPSGFYFQASPAPQTGEMVVDVLIPNNFSFGGVAPPGMNVPIIGGGEGVGTVALHLVAGNAWTSGTLGAFLVA